MQYVLRPRDQNAIQGEEHRDQRLVDRISEDRPMVKAYEDKVATDEQEYEVTPSHP
jgi:hypothetical protein